MAKLPISIKIKFVVTIMCLLAPGFAYASQALPKKFVVQEERKRSASYYAEASKDRESEIKTKASLQTLSAFAC